MLDLNKVHSSWSNFLTEQRIQQLKDIEFKIGTNYNPKKENVLRFLSRDLMEVRCIWLGQDVYPANQKEVVNKTTGKKEFMYVATGRSFEVGTLQSWTDKFAQHSLKNIVKLIYKTYYGKLLEYEDIKEKIKSYDYPILNPKEWFDNMESQGVLFLNTYLTCETGKANSHREIWDDFSRDLVKYISEQNESINWFLWGGEAQKTEKYISCGIIHKANHPRLYDTVKEKSFLNSTCFKETTNLIDWRGLPEYRVIAVLSENGVGFYTEKGTFTRVFEKAKRYKGWEEILIESKEVHCNHYLLTKIEALKLIEDLKE